MSPPDASVRALRRARVRVSLLRNVVGWGKEFRSVVVTLFADIFFGSENGGREFIS